MNLRLILISIDELLLLCGLVLNLCAFVATSSEYSGKEPFLLRFLFGWLRVCFTGNLQGAKVVVDFVLVHIRKDLRSLDLHGLGLDFYIIGFVSHVFFEFFSEDVAITVLCLDGFSWKHFINTWEYL